MAANSDGVSVLKTLTGSVFLVCLRAVLASHSLDRGQCLQGSAFFLDALGGLLPDPAALSRLDYPSARFPSASGGGLRAFLR